MNILSEVGLALTVGAGFFIAGYLAKSQQVITKTVMVPKIITQTKTVDHVVTKVITKTVRAKDGTTTTTTTTETTADKAKESAKNHSQPVAPPVASHSTRWTLGVTWQPRIDLDVYKPTGIDFGHRIGDTNAWATAGYDWRFHTALVGFRWDF